MNEAELLQGIRAHKRSMIMLLEKRMQLLGLDEDQEWHIHITMNNLLEVAILLSGKGSPDVDNDVRAIGNDLMAMTN